MSDQNKNTQLINVLDRIVRFIMMVLGIHTLYYHSI